jgi:flagellar biogenesis protein FliO
MNARSLRHAALSALALSSVLALGTPSHALDPVGNAVRAPTEPAAPSAAQEPALPAPAPAPSPSVAELPSPAAAPTGAAAPRSWLSQGSGAPLEAGSDDSSSSSRTGLTVGAVLVLLGLAAAAIVMRYKRQNLSPLGPSESRLTVLSSSRVGPKAFAVTAHVNGRVLLLGVTDHTVTNLGWLEPRDAEPASESARSERDANGEEDDLPDDYPGSALRASRVPPAFASSSNLKRFQEVLRGAEESRAELPLRPSYHPSPMDAASLIAAQTSDVVAAGPAPQKPKPSPVSIRRKRRGRDSIPPRETRPAAAVPGQKPADPSLEGQVAGLRALRNGG